MNSPAVSRLAIVGAIIRKDLTEFSRDRLWMTLSPLALIMFGVLFWVLPATVDETITAGVYPPELSAVLTGLGEGGAGTAEALRLVAFQSEEALAAAVAGEAPVAADGAHQVSVGLAFPDDFLARTVAGEQTTVRIYVGPAVPPELSGAMTSAVREIAFAIAGADLPVASLATHEIVLGTDRAGAQVPMRERLRPLLAFFVLVTESLVLASLIASEVGSRTVTAVMATPARTSDFLAAKGIFGTMLAFSQAAILLVVTQSFGANWFVLLGAVLLGAVMVSAIGMFSGAAGKDFMGTLFYGMVFLLVLAVPAFANLFPGTASPWVAALPSYGIIQAMTGAATYGLGLAELATDFAMATGWVVVLFLVSWVVLERKLRTL